MNYELGSREIELKPHKPPTYITERVRRESNPRHPGPEPGALSSELRTHDKIPLHYTTSRRSRAEISHD
jgi:hypothetical protein